ncbi:hypothetical protein EBZ02_06800, partial [bacterium]|nr:hypothetical protein [bacterium]
KNMVKKILLKKFYLYLIPLKKCFPKKEAEANVISEQAGYTSKTQIVTKLGTTYEQILKDKANERQLEQQYGVQIAAPQIQPDQPDANA